MNMGAMALTKKDHTSQNQYGDVSLSTPTPSRSFRGHRWHYLALSTCVGAFAHHLARLRDRISHEKAPMLSHCAPTPPLAPA